MEPACKPNSVLLLKLSRSGDHSSGRRITAPLLRPTRKRPRLRKAGRINPFRFPIWSCTAGGLPSRRVSPPPLVSLYLTVSPSPGLPEGLLRAVYSLLHSSVGSPRLAVSQPADPEVFGLSSGHAPRASRHSNCNLRFEIHPERIPRPPNPLHDSPGSIARASTPARFRPLGSDFCKVSIEIVLEVVEKDLRR